MAGVLAPRRRRWTDFQCYASYAYFFIVIFQLPLFRTPCRSGICTTPIQVTASQVIANEIFPVPIVKALLYPGAVTSSLLTNMTVPRWHNVLGIYNLTEAKIASALVDLERLEVLAGSYFCVAGAFVGLMKPGGRMSMFGTLLVVWGLVKEGIFRKPAADSDPRKAAFMSPVMLLALACAVFSVKYKGSGTRARGGYQSPPIIAAKPLKSSTKSKLK